MQRRTILGAGLLAALQLALALPAGDAAEASGRPELLVAAAADLVFALREIAPLFEERYHATVTLTFGSTGQLAQQIAHGLPADVFFAANESFIADLRARGAVQGGTVQTYAQGQIVLATPRTRRLPQALAELARDEIRRIAIANPEHAPYGMAAREALVSVGVWDRVQPKIVYSENIRQALQFLQTANVDAAILARSIADVPEIHYTVIAANLHRPIIQSTAVVASSRRPDLARTFIDFVNGAQGRPIMKRYGFLLPGEF